MTTGRRARHARWRGGNARMRLGRAVCGLARGLVRGVLIALLALSASAQETTRESVTSPDPAVAMWLEIRETDDRELLTAFVEAFPDSPYVHAARARLKRLEDPEAAPAAEPAPVRKRRRSR